jgi:multiple sugar transport system ATP-binding protein
MVAAVEPGVRARMNDSVRLAVNPERLHFFDARSEAVI